MRGRLQRTDAERRPAALSLEQLDVALTLLDGVAAKDPSRAREHRHELALDVAVVGEDHEPLARLQERLDPLDRGVQLSARGDVAQRVQLHERLGPQRAVDPLGELGRVVHLVAQPVDQVLLEVAVLVLVRERHRHGDTPLGRQLRQHVLLAPAHVTGAAQMPVEAFAGLLPFELPLERCAAAEVTKPPKRAQLRHELTRPVDQRRARQRQP